MFRPPRPRSIRRLLATLTAFALAILGTVANGAASEPAVPAQLPFRLATWPSSAPSPAFHLTDVDGIHRSSADYRGRVTVVFFGFARCPDICPTTLFNLALAKKHLGTMADRVGVIFVTLDPEHDSPSLLRDYVSAFDKTFIALTGAPTEVDRAARDFHVRYARVPIGADYTIDHSTALFVFDRSGRLRVVGTLASTADDLSHDLSILAAE